MPSTRPNKDTLIGNDPSVTPLSAQRILATSPKINSVWIGPDDDVELSSDELQYYRAAHEIMMHLCIDAPRKHSSGHPGGPLSAFTFSYNLLRIRDPKVDAALRMSAGHLSVLAYGLQYLGGRGEGDMRLKSPQAIIDTFRTPAGLPGHSEAGIGDIPFGFGPLGKGMSNAIGYALGRKIQNKPGWVDVLIGDGDSQEGQVVEAARIASTLKLDNVVVHADINDIQLSTVTSTVARNDLAEIFAAMGWAVIEVQNGNDIAQVAAAQEYANSLAGKGAPVFIAYYTTMGYGIKTMEQASNEGKATYHGAPMKDDAAEEELAKLRTLDELVDEFAPKRSELQSLYQNAPAASTPLPAPTSFETDIVAEKGAARKEFGGKHTLAAMKADERIIVLHADLAGSGGFGSVEKEFPDRIFNVGAAEANMYMMAAGLRQSGLLPLTYTFGAFGTNEARANARLIDINANHIPCSVFHDCTHCGLSVGEDGETHQERHYLNVPFDNTQIWSTADSNQAAAMVKKGFEYVAEGKTSVYTFMPRSGHEQVLTVDGHPFYSNEYEFTGKADTVRGTNTTKDQVTIIATGIMIHNAIAVADALATMENPVTCRVLNIACVRPIDASAIIRAALETEHLIVIEDHSSEGGVATQVADIIADFALPCSLRRLGVNHYFPSAPAKDLFFIAGLDEESLEDAVLDEIRTEVRGGEDALLTVIHQLPHNKMNSRFDVQVDEFIEQLLSTPEYLEHLREYWKQRSASETSLPSSEDLLEQLTRI